MTHSSHFGKNAFLKNHKQGISLKLKAVYKECLYVEGPEFGTDDSEVREHAFKEGSKAVGCPLCSVLIVGLLMVSL